MRSFILIVFVTTGLGPLPALSASSLIPNVLPNRRGEVAEVDPGSDSGADFGTPAPATAATIRTQTQKAVDPKPANPPENSKPPANPEPPENTDEVEAPGVGRPKNFLTANASINLFDFGYQHYDYFFKWPVPMIRRTDYFYNLLSQTLDPTGIKMVAGQITDPSEFQEFCRRLPTSIHALKKYAIQKAWHNKVAKAVINLVLDSVHQKYVAYYCKNLESVKKFISDNIKINSHISLLSNTLSWLLGSFASIGEMAKKPEKRLEAATYACCLYLDYKKNLSLAITDPYARSLVLDRVHKFYSPGHGPLCYDGSNYQHLKFDCSTVNYFRLKPPKDKSIHAWPMSLHMALFYMMEKI